SKTRTPSGARADGLVRYVLIWRMPKSTGAAASETPAPPGPDTRTCSRYSGWPPIWYGHHSWGCPITSWEKEAGVNVTVVAAPAASVTGWATWTAARPPGEVIAAVTTAACRVPVLLVTSACTVSAALDMPGASSWVT